MKIKFTKMHGLGNDFVVIDAINQKIDLTREQIRFLADRHFGVGCDQLLLVEKPNSADVNFNYRIFNADGGEVEQCGNGARCFARFVVDKGLINKDIIRVGTNSGKIELNLIDANKGGSQVQVNMGIPEFAPEKIPFQAKTQMSSYNLTVDGQEIQTAVVSIGNPHAVVEVENLEQAPVTTLGARLQNDSRFPKKVNVGFMQIMNRDHIRLRVYERGVGETKACGTGACAAMVVGYNNNKLSDDVLVDLPGGQLRIQWQGGNTPVLMTGPATTVFEGNIEL